METSKVYFTNLRTTPSSNLLDKMERKTCGHSKH